MLLENGHFSGLEIFFTRMVPIMMILVSDRLQFEHKSEGQDKDGRYILIDTLVQDSPFLFLNIYAPKKPLQNNVSFSQIFWTPWRTKNMIPSVSLLSEVILMLT